MKKEFIIPITAVICSVVLGGSFLAVQLNKQSSIEYQKEIQIQHEKEQKYNEEAEERESVRQLNACLAQAKLAYWDYVEINMTEKEDGTYWGAAYQWDAADKKQKNKEDSCFKQYK
jgi:hypothetical protein